MEHFSCCYMALAKTDEKIFQDLEAVAEAGNADQFAVWGDNFGGNMARYLGA